ncbi:hypothetical protein OAN35_03020 [Flavobacteriaceae bacterium]|nr:hypothetical protein [Flavobacteriaceae bacterium]
MGKNQSEISFCTFFDSNYYAHGLTMIHSLLKVDRQAVIYVVAMDNNCYNSLNEISNTRIKVFSIKGIEDHYPNLKITKSIRTKVEYYYSAKGFICHYILSKSDDIKSITYLDSDLFFFSNPKPIFDELNGASIGITKHNFHWLCLHQKKYGLFNAGWITFKKDLKGIKCLEDWMNDCVNWCYGYLEGEKYADQKYLNAWPKKYSGVRIINTKGANVALWNIKNYKISIKETNIFINKSPLIFYHFASLKQLDKNIFSTSLSSVLVSCKGLLRDKIYIPYLKEFLNNQNQHSLSTSKKETHSKGFITFIRDASRKVRSYFLNDIIKID